MTKVVENHTDIVELLVRICETPAPTFEESVRGKLLAELFAGVGLESSTDEVGNVMAALPGGVGPRVLVAAHLDTVFGRDVDVSVRSRRGRLCAPGIGDNSASLAVMIACAEALLREADAVYPQLTLAATVGEEGLGDLYGARHLIETHREDFDLFVALDGHLGTIVNTSVGSYRFEICFHAEGGHSWGDFPSPSATHALGDAIHALNTLSIPREARSSYNVGRVSGGTSINAIAQEARFNLDLRSVDAITLQDLKHEALRRIQRVAKQHRVTVEVEQVGYRAAAQVENGHLVMAAREALLEAGIEPRTVSSSTDANAAMAAGLPAIALGLYRGGDAHRLSEWLEPASLKTGFTVLWRFMAHLADLPPGL
ncbi:MAG: M20/M25/M40 family metallo-hydrolase [Trueperaceae bacterium]|nr:MAG: M20/M25/M40 family metallo-hydrolase [Trueperaceae bacterium]